MGDNETEGGRSVSGAMEQNTYHWSGKAFRDFIAWRQKYRLRRYQYSIYSIILIVIIIINCTSASINSEKFSLNSYDGDSNSNDNDNDGGNEHSRRHGHKYSQTIDSLLSSLKNSKAIFGDTPTMPRLPYDAFDGESVCPTCFFEKNSDELRLEAIKRQILSKLGLRQRPTITLPVPRDIILETLSRADGGDPLGGRAEGEEKQKEKEQEAEEEMVDSEPDDFYGRTSEIITFAEPGQLLNGQTLLEFSHSSEGDPGALVAQLRVRSALLWVRVALDRFPGPHLPPHPAAPHKNLTLWVFKVRPSVANTSFLSGKDFDEHTELVGSLSVSLTSLGWQKIDMTAAVREWYKDSSQQHREKLRLLVDCSGCKDIVQVLIFQSGKAGRGQSGFGGRPARGIEVRGGGRGKRERQGEEAGDSSSQGDRLDPNRAFLVVHTEPVVMKRSRRRALDCSGAVKGQCCKQNFFVSFKELKWDDWIIAPKGYQANYCRGDCGGIHRTPDTFLNYHTHVIEEYRKLDRLSGIQPCCAPIKFSSMSLIYFGPDNNIIKRDLPKMVVEQCGCP